MHISLVCTMHSSLCMHSTVSCITCMHFQCFKEKHCTLIVFHNKIFTKNGGGGQMHYFPPPIRFLGGGGHGPPAPPPVADPMSYGTTRTDISGVSGVAGPKSGVFDPLNQRELNTVFIMYEYLLCTILT